MALRYELWDKDSGNLVAVFDSEESALASVGRTLDAHGPTAVETLALGTSDENGDGELIAEGAALLAQARSAEADSMARD